MSCLVRRALFVLVLVSIGCAHHPTFRSPPPGDFGPGAGGPYRLQIGDELSIRFYQTPELNTEVTVRNDGKISLELVGDVPAAGLAPDDVARELTERYAHELDHPRLTVVVKSFGGRVFVGGEVRTPSAIPFSTGMTAIQAINGAGGFLDSAQPDDVVLIRQVDGRLRRYPLPLGVVLRGEDMSPNVPLQPTDVLEVPRSGVASVNVWVDQYIRKNLPVQPAIGPGL